jgi:AcrR family transcriptional regulator
LKTKKTQYHHGDLRRALINSGIELLETEGLDKLSLRKVARKAGVSQTAPYSHFKDKDALMASIAEVGFTRFTEELLKHAKGINGSQDRLLALARGYIHFAFNNRSLFRMMFGPRWEKAEQYPELQAVAEKSFLLLLNAVAKLVGQQSNEQKILVATYSTWSIIHGLANLLLDGQVCTKSIGGISDEELSDQIVKPLVQGLVKQR